MPSYDWSGFTDNDEADEDNIQDGGAMVRDGVVEWQIETMSTCATQVFLYSWYAVLVIALMIQSLVGLQWQARDLCTGHEVSFSSLGLWNSSTCVRRQTHWVPVDGEPEFHRGDVAAAARDAEGETSGTLGTWNIFAFQASDAPAWEAAAVSEREPRPDSPFTIANSGGNPHSRPTIAPYKKVYHVQWNASSFGGLLDRRFNRFMRAALSLASPMQNMTPGGAASRKYRVVVALEEFPFTPDDEENDSSDDERRSSSSSDSRGSRWKASLAPSHPRTPTVVVSSASSLPASSSSSLSSLSSSSSFSPTPPSYVKYTFNASVTCYRNAARCNTLVLPPTVAVPSTNTSYFSFTLLGVNAELGDAAWSAAVGFVYQRSPYTWATVVWRYVFMLYSLLSVSRFLYRSQQKQDPGVSSRLSYEQRWVLALQLGLLLYLDPLFLPGVLHPPVGNAAPPLPSTSSLVFLDKVPRLAAKTAASVWTSPRLMALTHFMEFHVPNYFVALCVSAGFAVIAASFDWRPRPVAPSTATPQAREERTPHQSDPQRDRVRGSRGLPPRRVTVAILAYLAVIVGLDVAMVFAEHWRWGTEAVCTSRACLPLKRTMQGCLAGGVLISCLALFWLRRNLSRRPYLETRPQQLACRVFIFVFFTGWAYMLAQTLLVRVLYPQLLDVVAYQPMIQLSPLMVATFFVNHMTMVYTSRRASRQVPPRPGKGRGAWKVSVWSSRWFRWVRWHGGSQYIFLNEQEERVFDAIQAVGKVPRLARSRRPRRPGAAEVVRSVPTSPHSHVRRAETDIFEEPSQRETEAGAEGSTPGWAPARGAARTSRRRNDQTTASQHHGRPRSCPPTPLGRRGMHILGSTNRDPQERGEEGAHALEADGDRSETEATPPTRPLSARDTDTLSSSSLSIHDVMEDPFVEEEDPFLDAEEDAPLLPHHDDTRSRLSRAASAGESAGGREEGIRNSMPPRAPRTVLKVLHGAEKAVTGGAGRLMDLVEDRVIDTSVHALTFASRLGVRQPRRQTGALHPQQTQGTGEDRHGQANRRTTATRTARSRRYRRHFFFNLETAIDCFNMSWEAYAVTESLGDAMISTGIDVDAESLPGCVSKFFYLLFSCYFAKRNGRPLREDEASTSIARSITIQVSAEDGDEGASSTAALPPLPKRGQHHPNGTALEQETGDSRDGIQGRLSPPTSPASSPAAAIPPAREQTTAGKTFTEASARPYNRRLSFSPLAVEQEKRDALLLSTVFTSTPSPAREAEALSVAPRTSSLAMVKPPPCSSSSTLSPPPPPSLAKPTSPAPALAASPRPGDDVAVAVMNPERFGYQRLAVFEEGGVQVVITRMDTTHPFHRHKCPRLVVAFRGTDNIANAMQDIRFQRRPWKEMERGVLSRRALVHSGFLEGWMGLKEQVLSTVFTELRRRYSARDAAAEPSSGVGTTWRSPPTNTPVWPPPLQGHNGCPTSPACQQQREEWEAFHEALHPPESFYDTVYITGHSLGSSVACLCAYSLHRLLLLTGYPNPEIVVYTFGQPRMGNRAFQRLYNRAIPQTFRVVNESDAVSGFNIFGGYHVGTEVDIDRYGNFISQPMFVERLFRPVRGRALQGVSSHSMLAYANSLNAIAERHAGHQRTFPGLFPTTIRGGGEGAGGRALAREERDGGSEGSPAQASEVWLNTTRGSRARCLEPYLAPLTEESGGEGAPSATEGEKDTEASA